jgi:hypothetical protein
MRVIQNDAHHINRKYMSQITLITIMIIFDQNYQLTFSHHHNTHHYHLLSFSVDPTFEKL